MSYIGTNKLGTMYLGDTKIGKAYLGSDLVYSSSVTPPMPYDSEIEYLQSSGTQWLDIGITISTNTIVETKAQFTVQDSTFQTLIGCANGGMGVMIGLQNNTGKLYIQVGNTEYALTDGSQTGLHVFTATVNGSTQSLDVDGTTSSSSIYTPICSRTMYLFARNREQGATNHAKVRLYYCKIWNGGNLVFDAIPVRVGTTGYMYDQVSGQLFGNSGSGSFTLGNDKS